MRRLGVLLVALTLLLLAPPAGAQDGQPRDRLRYVAMGDSYSAASGVLPIDLSSPACLRSTRNYPHVLAQATGARLTDVTCGAAETRHFTESQYPGVRPQLDALDARTDLVTMTIGGNDSSVFIGAIAACGAAGLTTLGQGSPCRDTYGSSFEDTIRTTTYPALVSSLAAVRAKAPHARVAILGYPWITPASGSCYPQLPVAAGDVAYLHSLQATLNDAVRRAAEATGATYVDLDALSTGHDACQRLGTRWVEPVVGTTNPVVVHPNALGERAMAAAARDALDLG